MNKAPKYEKVKRSSGTYYRRTWDRKAKKINWKKEAVMLVILPFTVVALLLTFLIWALKVLLKGVFKAYGYMWHFKLFKQLVVAVELIVLVMISYSAFFPKVEYLSSNATIRLRPVKVIYAEEEQKVEKKDEVKVEAKHATVAELIRKHFGKDADMALKIAKCESNLNPKAKNEHSTASGVFQIIKGTWISNRNAMGLSTNLDLRFDAEENVKTAKHLFDRRGWQPWECRKLVK